MSPIGQRPTNEILGQGSLLWKLPLEPDSGEGNQSSDFC